MGVLLSAQKPERIKVTQKWLKLTRGGQPLGRFNSFCVPVYLGARPKQKDWTLERFLQRFLSIHSRNCGRLIFIHHQCWEVLPFCRFQRQRCIKIRVLRAQNFYTPLPLKTAKGQHLPALVVYKNQSPTQAFRKSSS